MSDRPRESPYCWATWITGHLSGDKDCLWQPWFKAHHLYDKRPDDRAGDLAIWKAQHGDMVGDLSWELAGDGWTVYVEGQNKFHLKGNAVTLGGTPDIVAIRGDQARVFDCKTGQRRDSDFWQVVVYLCFLPLTHDAIGGRDLEGAVVYRDGQVDVPYPDDAMRERVVKMLKRVGSDDPPERTPSYSDCAWCDIASCPDRVTETNEVQTEAF